MKINKVITFVFCAIGILVFGGIYYSNATHQEKTVMSQDIEGQPSEKTESSVGEIEQSQNTIFVHVCGAVKRPGVYELTPDARVCDAIKAAKGLKKKAADTDVNQAQKVSDGEQIYIPYRSHNATVESDGATSATNDTDDRINLNSATLEELTTLPGIGDAKAASILAYREEHGSFASIEEIKNISGIKDGVYTKIEAYITV